MGFMRIETLRDVWYTVETESGESFLIPESVCGYLPIPSGQTAAMEDDTPGEDWESICSAVRDYTDGRPVWEVSASECWGARYSAPGYMDRTDWVLADTEQEARADCVALYGDDDADNNDDDADNNDDDAQD